MAIEFRNINTQKVVRVRHEREAARLDKLPHYERVVPRAKRKKAPARKATAAKKAPAREVSPENGD